MQELIVSTLASAPDSAPPIDAVAVALEAAGAVIQEGGDRPRKRQEFIAANAELQERELIKMATLASAIAGALRERGVPDPAASLAAEAGIAVFRIAFERWISDPVANVPPRLSSIRLPPVLPITSTRHPRARCCLIRQTSALAGKVSA